MTRSLTDKDGRRFAGWALLCDELGCRSQSDVRPLQRDLPLDEFRAAGWFIAEKYGDKCPVCAERTDR